MYNKLFSKILDSSIWLEPDPVRLVWITLLAAMDQDGYAHFSAIQNLADRARVGLEQAKDAVERLMAPDPESGIQEHDGRRIERVPGGFLILNAKHYRDMVSRQIQRDNTRERVRRYRDRKKGVTQRNDLVTPSEAYTDADTDKDKSATALPGWLDGGVWQEWVRYRRELRKPLTPSTLARQLRFLETRSGQHRAIIEQSIRAGWTGLFDLKEVRHENRSGIDNSAPARVARANAKYLKSVGG